MSDINALRVRYEGLYVRPAGGMPFEKPRLPIPGTGPLAFPLSIATDVSFCHPRKGCSFKGKNGWKMIDHSHGLHGVVYAALDDRQHSLWIGTAGRGIVQRRGYGEWEAYSSASGMADDIVYEVCLADPSPSAQRAAKGGGCIFYGRQGHALRLMM